MIRIGCVLKQRIGWARECGRNRRHSQRSVTLSRGYRSPLSYPLLFRLRQVPRVHGRDPPTAGIMWSGLRRESDHEHSSRSGEIRQGGVKRQPSVRVFRSRFAKRNELVKTNMASLRSRAFARGFSHANPSCSSQPRTPDKPPPRRQPRAAGVAAFDTQPDPRPPPRRMSRRPCRGVTENAGARASRGGERQQTRRRKGPPPPPPPPCSLNDHMAASGVVVHRTGRA